MAHKLEQIIKSRTPIYYTVAGTSITALSSAFIGDYSIKEAWTPVNDGATFIAFLLTLSYLWLAVGIISYAIGSLSSHFREKELSTENGLLKQEKFTLENTASDKTNKINELINETNKLKSITIELQEKTFRLHENKVETWLKGLCKHIELDNKSRVSLFYSGPESFKLISRSSPNPLLSKFKPKLYHLERGALSKAWQHGTHTNSTIPDDHEEYLSFMSSKYGYSESDVKEIRMKSKSIYGLSITDADESVGVIFFESEEQLTFNSLKINEIEKYCRDFQSYLCGFIRDSRRNDLTMNNSRQQRKRSTDEDILLKHKHEREEYQA